LLNKNFYLILIISAVFGISFWIGFNVNLLPVEASINAPIYDELFQILFIIGLIIFIGMTIAVIYSLFKFRKRKDQFGDGIALEGNLSLEIVWTIIPSIIVLIIGLYSYNIYDRMGGMKELNHSHEMMTTNTEKIWAGISQASNNEVASNNLSVEVSAMQFAFLFNYPKGEFISGELHVPVDHKVSMKMESKDVIHAFWVPEFRIKQDIIPGQPTILNFTPTKVGKYPIICAELCGPYHGGMRASIIVEKESDYKDWFNKNTKTEVSL
jgi:cytochrome c oxidase subunit 2